MMLRIGGRGQLSASSLLYIRHQWRHGFTEEGLMYSAQGLIFSLRVQAAKLRLMNLL